MRQRQAGFTLIELMIAVAIVAILAMVAVPSYREHIQRGKRADGKAFLLDLASRQERFYTQYSSYTGVLTKSSGCTASACGLGLSANTSPDRYYTVAMTSTPSGCSATGTLCTGYALTATTNGWTDDKCRTLTLNHTATKGNSGTGSIDDCWR